ncbi:MAG: NAD(P)H-hydrate dehydratase [Thermoplasmata archaeon]|nr:MAG: NAD(P)H-hydrate dehydratase [Thermoplasmata archaeon]
MLEFQEVMVLDRNAEALGVPTSTLMENAGLVVAGFIKNRYIKAGKLKKSPPEIVIFCGPGNNGGDGFVAARYLHKEASVKIVLTASSEGIKTELAKHNFDKIPKDISVEANPSNEDTASILENANLIVDAMLGVGLTGELRSPYSDYIDLIIRSNLPVVAVDAPTGLGTPTALKPTHTVTFHDSKIGMNEDNSGEIVIAPIGIPEEAARYIGPGELVVYYPRPAEGSHKGQNGRLLIVGGGPYTGAPALAALAALRTGVDLVHIATPSRCVTPISAFSPNFIVHELKGSGGEFIGPEDQKKVMELCSFCDACVLGPGIGRNKATETFVKNFLGESEIPIVLDADGLFALSSMGENELKVPGKGWIITPHFTEFIRLVKTYLKQIVENDSNSEENLTPDSPDIEDLCKELSARLGAVVVLKGKEDIVCDSEHLKLNRTGNPGMTVGGTGDVLAGIIGALAAKNVSLYNSARIGTFLNGYAGDITWSELGPGLTSTDIIDKLPAVLTKFILF